VPKNIRLAEKYFNFGWDSAESPKISATARRRLTKLGAAALGGGAWVYQLYLNRHLCSGHTSAWIACYVTALVKRLKVCRLIPLRATGRHLRLPYGITHVTCHPTQANAPRLNPNQ